MVDIPPEIWHHIIRFLPPASLQQLYGINHVFFDVVMNEKYRHVAFEHKDKHAIQKLDSLRNPDIARRVNSLRIAPHVFCVPSQTQKIKIRDVPTRPFNLLRRIVDHIKKPRRIRNDEDSSGLMCESSLCRSPVIEDLLEVAQLLTNTTDFNLEWGSFEDCSDVYMDSLWPTFASILQNLTIFATTKKMKTLLPLPVVTFPRLASLHITIKRKNDPLEEEADLRDTQLAMASFVSSVGNTLRHLSIHCIPGHDFSLFYERVGYLRHLESIDLDLTVASPSALLEQPILYSSLFLQRHRDTIQHLSVSASNLRVFTMRQDAPQADYVLSFPKLKSFSIGSNLLTGRRKHAEDFLKRHVSGLQSLEIVGPISPHELDELLAVLNGTRTPHDSILTKLSISIYRLDLNLMLKFVKWLPALKILRLRIMRVANGTSFSFDPGQYFPLRLPPHENVHDFVTEVMACEELKSWHLRDIMITRHSCCADLTLWSLMRFFAGCIPTIASFAEMGHMDIPEPPNPKPRYDTPRCPGGSYGCFYGTDGLDA